MWKIKNVFTLGPMAHATLVHHKGMDWEVNNKIWVVKRDKKMFESWYLEIWNWNWIFYLIHGDYSMGVTGVLFDNFFVLRSQNKFHCEFGFFWKKNTQKSTHFGGKQIWSCQILDLWVLVGLQIRHDFQILLLSRLTSSQLGLISSSSGGWSVVHLLDKIN